MIDVLLNHMRHQAQLVLSQVAFSRMGTIKAFDKTTYRAQVQIEPFDDEDPNNSVTAFLPILSPWVGNGWGIVGSPEIGSSCMVHFSEGNYNAGVVSLMLFNQSFAPPEVEDGELWLVHASGTAIKLTQDGKLLLNGNDSVEIGKLSEGNLKKLMTETAMAVYNNHTHPNNGAPPTQQMSASDLTTYTEAN